MSNANLCTQGLSHSKDWTRKLIDADIPSPFWVRFSQINIIKEYQGGRDVTEQGVGALVTLFQAGKLDVHDFRNHMDGILTTTISSAELRDIPTTEYEDGMAFLPRHLRVNLVSGHHRKAALEAHVASFATGKEAAEHLRWPMRLKTSGMFLTVRLTDQ